MRVSIVITVLNEAHALRRLLDSLAAQTFAADEVVLVDGGSTDGTPAIAAEYTGRLPLRVVSAPGANISQGRNIAIRQASGDIIAVTDAGVIADPRWLELLTRPLRETGALAVAGFFKAEGDTPFDIAMGATVLPQVADVNPRTYLPSNRSIAFRRQAWQAAGGYPEWLDYCEDVVFDMNLRRHTGPFEFRPEAFVWFRPRTTLGAFVRQYYLYARGDGKANLFPRIQAIRYFTYLVLVPLIAYSALTINPWLWLLYGVGGLAYLRRPYQRLWPLLKSLRPGQRAAAVAYVPIIRIAGDLAKLAGYPAGVWWRLRHPVPRLQPQNTNL
jgi:glycosyltransferase involved in cell wall biosynthesis